MSWVRITSNDYGVGAGAVMYSVDANPGVTARKATLTIAGQIHAIKQKGIVGGFKIKP